MHTWGCHSERKLVTLTPVEAKRRQMSEAFTVTHGVEVADIIMEHLPPAGWSDLATRRDLSEQGLLLRSELRSEMAQLRSELRGEMAQLRTELCGEIAKVRDELRKEMNDGFRSQLRWMTGTFLTLFIGSTTLISTFLLTVK